MMCECGHRLFNGTRPQGKPVSFNLKVLDCTWCGNAYCAVCNTKLKDWGNADICPKCYPDINHVSDLEWYYKQKGVSDERAKQDTKGTESA